MPPTATTDNAAVAEPAARKTKVVQASKVASTFVATASALPTAHAHLYMHIATTFKSICGIKGRLEITSKLRKMFLSVLEATKADQQAQIRTVIAAVYLCCNAVAPQHKGVELGVGGSVVSQAVAEVTGRSRDHLRTSYRKLGDMGDVAFQAKATVRSIRGPKPLTIVEVFDSLLALAAMKGQGSAGRKRSLVVKLLVRSRGEEIRFVVRTLLQHLRTGAVGKILQAAVAHAFCDFLGISGKEPLHQAADDLQVCFSQHPQWDTIISALVTGGFDRMRVACAPSPGVPITPMLAKVAGDLGELLDQMDGKRFQADYKYDGVRAQVHLEDVGRVHIFSRHLEDVSERYPDVVAAVRGSKTAGTTSFIVDAEIVAFDREKDEILPFQTLMSRPRKAVMVASITVNVKLLLFDIMSLNGESLLTLPFAERVQLLHAHFEVVVGQVGFVEHKIFTPDADGTHELEPLQHYLRSAFSARCEGLMIKELGGSTDNDAREARSEDTTIASAAHAGASAVDTPRPAKAARKSSTQAREKASAAKPEVGLVDEGSRPAAKSDSATYAPSDSATYAPSARCKNWLKVKRDYLTDSVADSLDVVPIAAWWGNGRKAGWYSPFLVAVWDPETETFQALCKV